MFFELAFSPLLAQPAKLRVLTVSDGAVFEKLAVGLEPAKLLRMYGPALKIKQFSRNRHDPAGRGTLLTTGNGADRLEMFKNQYNSFL